MSGLSRARPKYVFRTVQRFGLRHALTRQQQQQQCPPSSSSLSRWTLTANITVDGGGVNHLKYLPHALFAPLALVGGRMGMRLTLTCGPHVIAITMVGGRWYIVNNGCREEAQCTRDCEEEGGVRDSNTVIKKKGASVVWYRKCNVKAFPQREGRPDRVSA